MPWILCGRGLEVLAGEFLGDDRAFLRLDGDGDDFLALRVLDVARHAGDGAAGADAGDEHVDGAIGVVPDFGAGGLLVDGRIGGILELLGQEIFLGVGGGDVLGARDGAFHAFGAGGENQVGAQSGQHAAAFDAHGLRHGEGELVAARGGDIGQGDAGVAAGGLDDFDAGLEQAALFGIPDHGGADAALDGVGGVAAFDLGQDGGLGALRDAVQSHQRGVADGFRVVFVDFAHGDSFGVIPYRNTIQLTVCQTAKIFLNNS